MVEQIRQRYQSIRERIEAACVRAGRSPEQVRVIAVTKTHPFETVQAVIDAGIRDIGENKVQELADKAPRVRGNPTLHMIGHLQTNKVAKAVRLASWIQSVDSRRLLEKIAAQCERFDKEIHVLIQVNASGEPSKFGCDPHEAVALCEQCAATPRLAFRGLMTLGPLAGAERETRASFAAVRELGRRCESLAPGPIELSMGMSGDFAWAVEEGATMVRIGSLLVGRREYP